MKESERVANNDKYGCDCDVDVLAAVSTCLLFILGMVAHSSAETGVCNIIVQYHNFRATFPRYLRGLGKLTIAQARILATSCGGFTQPHVTVSFKCALTSLCRRSWRLCPRSRCRRPCGCGRDALQQKREKGRKKAFSKNER